MALAVVQSTKGVAAGFSTSLALTAFASSNTAGNTIVIGVQTQVGSSDITSITDTKGNSYVFQGMVSVSSMSLEVWVAQNIGTQASNIITVHDSGSEIGSAIAYELSGVATSGRIVDVIKSASGSGGSLSTGASATTANANEVIVAFGNLSTNTAGTWTVGLSYSNLVSATGGSGASYTMAGETKIVSSTGTQTATLSQTTSNQNYEIILIGISAVALITPPSVITTSTTSIAENTATANGQITALGTSTPTVRGFVYDTSSHALPGNVAVGSSGYASHAEDTGSYSTGIYSKGLTGLTKSTLYFVRAYSQSADGYGYGNESSFTTNPGTPLLDKFSASDSGFVDITNGADTDPFASADQVGFTVQAGDTLSPGTYYWRVRAKDPSGSNTYGAWSATRSFTTSSAATYTRTHTTDTNKRLAGILKTHTTDVNKRLSGVLKTHTTDTFKLQRATKTHTTDVFKRQTVLKSHTTDTLKRIATTKVHTTDVNKRLTGILRTHTTDTYKRFTATRTHTTDTNKRVSGVLRSHTTDTNKRKSGVLRTHTTDTLLRKTFVRTHTTDTNLRKTGILRSHTTDVNKLKSGVLKTHTTDILKRKAVLKTHTTDTLKHSTVAKAHTTDTFKRAAVTKTHTTDTLKRKATLRIHTTDANKRLSGVLKTHTTDTLKRKNVTRTHTTDTFKRASVLKTHTTDTLKRKPTLRTHTTDTNKRAAGLTRSHTTDVNKTIQNTRTHSTDTFKRTTFTTSHTTDTYLLPRAVYTRGVVTSEPTDDNDLATSFSAQDYLDVASDNDVYVSINGMPVTMFLFKDRSNNSTSPVAVSWKGKSRVSCAVWTTYLQIYNRTNGNWETLASDASTAAGTEFILAGNQSTNLSNYYSASNLITCRVYQRVA